MKIQAYRCTWDALGLTDYYEHAGPLLHDWADGHPDEVDALVFKIDADHEIERKDAAIAELVSAVKAMLALDKKFTSARIELIEDLAQGRGNTAKMARSVLIARKAIAKHDHIADGGKVPPNFKHEGCELASIPHDAPVGREE